MTAKQDSYAFLKKYQKLQLEIAYDKLTDLGSAILGSSKIDASTYWNNALTNQILSDDQIAKVEQMLEGLGRKPTFYYDESKLKLLSNKLKAKHHKKSFEDSWLFWDQRQINSTHFDHIKKVNTLTELEEFLATFDACYQAGDPQNPYGELGDYIRLAKQAWRKNHASGKLDYFIVYKGNKPVGVSSLTNFEGIGYISNVGSLKEVRSQGYGKAATLFCVNQSLGKGNTVHCLATEEGDYPNEFYKRIGFKDAFKAIGYTRSN